MRWTARRADDERDGRLEGQTMSEMDGDGQMMSNAIVANWLLAAEATKNKLYQEGAMEIPILFMCFQDLCSKCLLKISCPL